MGRTDTAVRVISASPDRLYGTMTMTWEVTPVDDVSDEINAADHAAGLSSSLDNLALKARASWSATSGSTRG